MKGVIKQHSPVALRMAGLLWMRPKFLRKKCISTERLRKTLMARAWKLEESELSTPGRPKAA